MGLTQQEIAFLIQLAERAPKSIGDQIALQAVVNKINEIFAPGAAENGSAPPEEKDTATEKEAL